MKTPVWGRQIGDARQRELIRARGRDGLSGETACGLLALRTRYPKTWLLSLSFFFEAEARQPGS